MVTDILLRRCFVDKHKLDQSLQSDTSQYPFCSWPHLFFLSFFCDRGYIFTMLLTYTYFYTRSSLKLSFLQFRNSSVNVMDLISLVTTSFCSGVCSESHYCSKPVCSSVWILKYTFTSLSSVLFLSVSYKASEACLWV